MVDLNIELPESFFQEEVRNGFTVTRDIKELWAVELDLVNEFDRVCKKHNLRYMLDFGTLLGAIRHKGFIPWDVDMDVSMLREDYEKLQEIGPQEFKHPYFFQNQFTEEKYDHSVTRIRRSDTTSLNASDLIYRRKSNQGIFLDVEVFDNVPTDDRRVVTGIHKKCKTLCHAVEALSEPPSTKGYGTKMSLYLILRYLYFKCRFWSLDNAWKCLTRASSQFGYSDYVSCLFSDIPTRVRRREWHETMVRMPFENLMLPVPVAYDEVLKETYGDYLTPVMDTNLRVLYSNASRSYSDLINEPGFYEKISKELGLDLDKMQLSDWDLLKLALKKVIGKFRH